ncbi:MAG: hypothetical protein WBP08_00200, partial [Saprospiraceae bacterium]
MKKVFYFGLIGLVLFEFLNVYFIMPLSGSQKMNSIDLAYFLYSYRWIFRAIFIVLILFGSVQTFQHKNKWWHLSALLSICV